MTRKKLSTVLTACFSSVLFLLAWCPLVTDVLPDFFGTFILDKTSLVLAKAELGGRAEPRFRWRPSGGSSFSRSGSGDGDDSGGARQLRGSGGKEGRESESGLSGSNVWVLLVGTSRNWLNYRDSSNTLALYRSVRRLGVPDERIILMLGDDMACNPRNPYPSKVFNTPDHRLNLYGNHVEVDYRGAEVTVENFLRVLTGRHHPSTPRSKRLLSDSRSNVLIYLTGHGGDKFLKFQDREEIQSNDIADAIHQMHQKQRYRSILLISDTCQAATLHTEIYSPGVIAIGSASKGQNSYSYNQDAELGIALVDRFTLQALQFLERIDSHSSASLKSLLDTFDPNFLLATPVFHTDLLNNSIEKVPIMSFFGSTRPAHIMNRPYQGYVGRPRRST